MPRKTKYQPLTDFLLQSQKDKITLTFNQIEEILGFPLSPSHRTYRANWSNNEVEALSWGWRLAGYESYAVDMKNEIANFRKIGIDKINNHYNTNLTQKSNDVQIKLESIYNKYKVNIKEIVDKFIYIYQNDTNGRYLSYDHVREAFLKYRKDESKRDFITLHLYAYLASWGMLRNSFLIQKDYLFSKPVIDILCDDKYDSLLELNPFDEIPTNQIDLIIDLANSIKRYYIGNTYFQEGNNKPTKITNATDTLISKILLGTIGCTIAYDRYATLGLSNMNISKKLCKNSLNQLNRFAIANKDEIKELLFTLNKTNDIYTPMKIIDMYFFEKGFEIESTNKKQ